MKLIKLIELLPDADIPCNGCTTCCQGTIVPLLDGEDFPHVVVEGQRILPRDKSGNCIFLTEDGCGAWPNSPRACRTFDCVVATKAGIEKRSWVRKEAARMAHLHDPKVPWILDEEPVDFRIDNPEGQ